MPLEARVLLGWMDRDQAVKFLQQNCVFDHPLTDEEASDLWRPFHERVKKIKRPVRIPERQVLNDRERLQAREAMEAYRRLNILNVQEIVKINPMELVVHQHHVLMGRALDYSVTLKNSDAWFKEAIKPIVPAAKQVQIYSGMNAVNIDVPHGEFFFAHDPVNGFAIHEFMRHVSAWELAEHNRMILWAGYHRSYARMVNAAPDANVRSLLMVLADVGTVDVFPDAPNGGLRGIVCGATPPLFGDFFDELFFVTVNLRKKRFQIQVRANCVPLDDPT